MKKKLKEEIKLKKTGDTCLLITIQVGTKVPCAFPDLSECGFFYTKGKSNGEALVHCIYQELEKQLQSRKRRKKNN